MSLFQPAPRTMVIGDNIVCTKHVDQEPCRVCPYCALQLVSEAMVEANLLVANNTTTIRVLWSTSQGMLARMRHG